MSNLAFSVSANVTTAATKTMVTLTSTAAITPKIPSMLFSASAAPADQVTQFQLKRFTAPGTNTAYVPRPRGNNANVAAAIAGFNNSVEPTYGGVTPEAQFSLNQRATFQLIFVPGMEIWLPPTANNGVAIFSNAVSTGYAADFTIDYLE